MHLPSTRASIVTRRTYCRPIDESQSIFETWDQVVGRVIEHQKWLWSRALNRDLTNKENLELEELRALMLGRKVLTSGRVLWMGGTEKAKEVSSSQFACAFTEAQTVNDIVDIFWLLLQGCGQGFKARSGSLSGFSTRISEISVVPSERTDTGGAEFNSESWDNENKTWTITVGDSARSWAKAIGKICAGKYPGCKKLVLDFSQIRPSGLRLKGYGWISNGWEPLSEAFLNIINILNLRAGGLLRNMDIHDIINHLGTVLNSRKSAQISFYNHGDDGWEEFARCKTEEDPSNPVNPHRHQSNNTLMYLEKPTLKEIRHHIEIMIESGGSEPGMCNFKEATRRAPWFTGGNPCFEILLPNKGFCNLVEIDLGKFVNDISGLERATWIAARANYRQTLVDFEDGILSHQWTHNHTHLRLCGVSVTGIVKVPHMQAYDVKRIRTAATLGAHSMADDLGLEKPKNVTCGKPSGTLSKIMDTTEGIHKPLGRYIFNNIDFKCDDPLVRKLALAGYRIRNHPFNKQSVLVTFPQEFSGIPFDKVVVGGKMVEINNESAIDQLERYKFWQKNWCDQNMSCTIMYDPREADDIAQWLFDNWENYVGVSFLFRTDPTKTAEDLGYAYLPQEVVDEETFRNYEKTLKQINLAADTGEELVDADCLSGNCPVR